MTLETDRPDIAEWLAQDVARRRALGHCARMVQDFETPQGRAARRDAEARRAERRNAWFWRLSLAAIAALAVLWGFALLAHVAPVAMHHYANPAQIEH